jgi:hypothetical protein
MRVIIPLIMSIACVFGCQSTTDIRAGSEPPDWVLRVPEIKGMICSVGMSDPTFYEEEAKINSAEIARKELAKTLSINIKTIMIDMASERGDSVDEATVMQVSSWASTAVVQNAKILEYWHDTKGMVSNRKNSTYALSCMPRKFNKDELKAELINASRSTDMKLQETSRTADKIIKQLEEFE